MANEIQYRHTTTGADTIYAVVRKAVTNQYWDTTGSPAFETLVPASWTDYDIAMSETPASGYTYTGAFPAGITAGRYNVDIYLRAGGSPAITDTLLATGVMDWDGAAEILPSTIDATADAILVDTNELQAQFDDVDSTGTEVITAAKAMEICLAILGGNATFNTNTRVWTIYGRDGSTSLWTVTESNTVNGTRTASTKV